MSNIEPNNQIGTNLTTNVNNHLILGDSHNSRGAQALQDIGQNMNTQNGLLDFISFFFCLLYTRIKRYNLRIKLTADFTVLHLLATTLIPFGFPVWSITHVQTYAAHEYSAHHFFFKF